MYLAASPLSWALLICLILFGWRYLAKWLRWPLLGLEILLIVLMCPLGANALVAEIESRVPATAVCAAPEPATIVVLSGGFAREPRDVDDYAALDAGSMRRLLAGVALWRRIPDATLVLVGGGPYPIHESQVLARLATQLGVPESIMRTEGLSQTTWENAQNLRDLRLVAGDRIWLVSSALHLPRATTAFETFGFKPCVYASDRMYLPPGGLGYFLPQSSALRKSEAAIHEVIGELVYRWRARSVSS